MTRGLLNCSSPIDESPYMPSKIYLGRIKIGTKIYQDQLFGQWPECKPPLSEYKDAKNEWIMFQAKDPNMIFEMRLIEPGKWICKADGYGMLKSQGDIGEYGNGGIFAYGDVEIIGERE